MAVSWHGFAHWVAEHVIVKGILEYGYLMNQTPGEKLRHDVAKG